MHTKAKERRRRNAKAWVRQYTGRHIIHDYKRKFHIPILTAIIDLEAIGVELDKREVAQIRLDQYDYGAQQLPKQKLEDLRRVLCDACDDSTTL